MSSTYIFHLLLHPYFFGDHKGKKNHVENSVVFYCFFLVLEVKILKISKHLLGLLCYLVLIESTRTSYLEGCSLVALTVDLDT